MKARVDTTKLTADHLAAQGWTLTETVEWYDPRARVTHDLFGIFDVIALRSGRTVAVQCTTRSNVNSRMSKIRMSPNYGPVKDAGWEVRVHGWASDDDGGWFLARDVEL